jgi:hypothetical protein
MRCGWVTVSSLPSAICAHVTIRPKWPATSDHMHRRGTQSKAKQEMPAGVGEWCAALAALPNSRRARCARSSPCARGGRQVPSIGTDAGGEAWSLTGAANGMRLGLRCRAHRCQMRAYFTGFPNRPAACDHVDRRGRNSKRLALQALGETGSGYCRKLNCPPCPGPGHMPWTPIACFGSQFIESPI